MLGLAVICSFSSPLGTAEVIEVLLLTTIFTHTILGILQSGKM